MILDNLQRTAPENYRRVQLLSDVVVNQIAAGEVVERPASVVKELVENSLDAGANEITVIADNGGKSFIEIRDNGSGMSEQDALLSVERFATSKVRSVDDLLGISTFGFRGEALSSIASVSSFVLQTREAREAKGTKLLIEGGKLRTVETVDCETGTTVSIRRLFFNVPARRKFLRADTTEEAQIKVVLQDMALANPAVRFNLVLDGRSVFSYEPVADFFARTVSVLGCNNEFLSIAPPAVPERELITVSAMLSLPHLAVSGAGKLRLIVNGRVVRDKLLLRAVKDGYGSLLAPGRYPSGVLALQLDTELVDVNVHPQKTEVRFRDPRAVMVVVSGVIRRRLESERVDISLRSSALLTDNLFLQDAGRVASWGVGTPLADRGQSYHVDGNISGATEVVTSDGGYAYTTDAISLWAEKEVRVAVDTETQTSVIQSSVPQTSVPLGRLRYLGQVFQCYLIFADEKRFVLLDMHAAHERITYSQLKQAFLEAAPVTQVLLLPEIIELDAASLDDFAHYAPALCKVGFDCEVFGEREVIVRGVPAILRDCNIQQLFLELQSIEHSGSWMGGVETRIDAVLARLACHGSVRSGRMLKEEEAYSLLDALQEAISGPFCPHGRPVMRMMNELDIELMFARR
ncbi:MAG: DNA mismatch repair endonuclease MutL [bacterium]|nr:DNA mismatch repair endonuclease MutL [bacterium]